MTLLVATLSALAYTLGGIFMKLSHGLMFPLPTLAVYGLVFIGVTLQILLTNNADLSITYIFILGLEAVLATIFGICIFQEKLSSLNWFGMVLVVIGVTFLHSQHKSSVM